MHKNAFSYEQSRQSYLKLEQHWPLSRRWWSLSFLKLRIIVIWCFISHWWLISLGVLLYADDVVFQHPSYAGVFSMRICRNSHRKKTVTCSKYILLFQHTLSLSFSLSFSMFNYSSYSWLPTKRGRLWKVIFTFLKFYSSSISVRFRPYP